MLALSYGVIPLLKKLHYLMLGTSYHNHIAHSSNRLVPQNAFRKVVQCIEFGLSDSALSFFNVEIGTKLLF